MIQRISLFFVIVCAGTIASMGQEQPVNLAPLGISKLAYEVPIYTQITTSGTPGYIGIYNQEVDRDIFVIEAQNSKPRKLVGGGGNPVWSPDGSQLAYCAWKGMGFGQIEIVNADGTGKRQVTNMKGGACFPDWSPDGTKIAFTALSSGATEKNLLGASHTEIYVVDKNGGDPIPILPGYDARWSPGGSMFVLLRGPEKKGPNGSVWLATTDGKQSKVLVTSDRRVASVAWLPGGKSIAVSSVHNERCSIFRIYIDGSQSQGNQTQKIAGDDKANWYEPSVSPDGKHLITIKDCASGYGDENTGCRSFTIVLLDLGANTNEKLVDGSYYSVVWEKK